MAAPIPKYYWDFHEGSGTTATDIISGAVMQIDRADSWRAGKYDTGLRFHPKNGVRVVRTTLPNLPQPWTAAFWVYREEDTESSCLFSSDKYGIKLEQYPNLHTLGITEFGSADYGIGFATPLREWVHLVFVSDAGVTKLFVNGTLHGTIPHSYPLGMEYFGSRSGWVEFSAMIIDEVKIYDRVLSDTEAEQVHDASPKKNPKITLQLNGQSIANGGSTDWGPHAYAQSQAGTLSVGNSGLGKLTYTIQMTDASGEFGLTVPAPASGKILESGASASFPLSFTSNKAGRVAATVTITSDDPDTPSFVYTIYAAGAELPPPPPPPPPKKPQRFTLLQHYSFSKIFDVRLTHGQSVTYGYYRPTDQFTALALGIVNEGENDLVIQGASLSQNDHFKITCDIGTSQGRTPSFPMTVAAGQKTWLFLVAWQGGPNTTTLTLRTNDPTQSTFSINVQIDRALASWQIRGPAPQ